MFFLDKIQFPKQVLATSHNLEHIPLTNVLLNNKSLASVILSFSIKVKISGIGLFKGHPLTQEGFLHFKHFLAIFYQ